MSREFAGESGGSIILSDVWVFPCKGRGFAGLRPENMRSYDTFCPRVLEGLWRDILNFGFVSDFVARRRESILGLQGLLEMIDDIVPDVYLKTPASLKNEKFFD
jgi:hypothetical protein